MKYFEMIAVKGKGMYHCVDKDESLEKFLEQGIVSKFYNAPGWACKVREVNEERYIEFGKRFEKLYNDAGNMLIPEIRAFLEATRKGEIK